MTLHVARRDERSNDAGIPVATPAAAPHVDPQVPKRHEVLPLKALDDYPALACARGLGQPRKEKADPPSLSAVSIAPGLLLARAERHGGAEGERRVASC